MLRAARHDDKFAGREFDRSVTKLDAEISLDGEKHLVFARVLMPRKFALKFNKLDFLTVKLTDHFRSAHS